MFVDCIFFFFLFSSIPVAGLSFIVVRLHYPFLILILLCIAKNVTTCNMICSQITNTKAFNRRKNNISYLCHSPFVTFSSSFPIFSVQHSFYKSECKIRTNTLLKSWKLEFRNEKFMCGKNGLNVQNENPDANIRCFGFVYEYFDAFLQSVCQHRKLSE